MSRNAFASVLPLTTTLIWPVRWTTNRRFVPSSAPVTKIGWLNPVSGELSLIVVAGRGVGVGVLAGVGVGPGFLVEISAGPGAGLPSAVTEPFGPEEPLAPGARLVWLIPGLAAGDALEPVRELTVQPARTITTIAPIRTGMDEARSCRGASNPSFKRTHAVRPAKYEPDAVRLAGWVLAGDR
jgi:hypothetical protein